MQKKQKNCDENNPDDAQCDDNWDHVALDTEHKLVWQVQNGKRTETNTKKLAHKTAKRLKNKPPRLITSDEYKPCKKAILEAFGIKRVPKGLVYATVHKKRGKGRVKKIEYRTVFGTDEQVQSALKESKCSRRVNTSFIEHQNGTDRNRCSRKVRKSYCFSKRWDVHGAATCLSMYSYHFCWGCGRCVVRMVSWVCVLRRCRRDSPITSGQSKNG